MTTRDPLLAELVLDKQGSQVLYLALAEHIEAQILVGTLRAGSRLPAQREIARQLDLNLTTVTRAFKVLHDKNLISSRVGSGSVVTRPYTEATDGAYSSAPQSGGVLDLTVNRPASPAFLEVLSELLPSLTKDEQIGRAHV